ncbi:hypothetical protein SAMN02745151_02381 [[Clostridium] propionicum DSM 1682]|uniref:Uncharacterized protein n=1 Tax=Anaerotignum propionicum DSM 1682 TaxID=991789 RepID=A0A0X1U8T6_ANAPI|nr:hypothetical protein CPRO_17540 [Anaerotignum propionicum DSM 1682]SHE97467.1 hypothetical protein SAMN02745151_02381 [[Clostridium] propionicum DSM 1682] [Anaerotignum propionicum DSM 1682]
MNKKNKKLTASKIAANMIKNDSTDRRYYEVSANERNEVLPRLYA